MCTKIERAEKASLIDQYIVLKEKHQDLFFKHQKIVSENTELKMALVKLKKENDELKLKSIVEPNRSPVEKSLLRENKNLLAKLNQLKRCSTTNFTPHRTSVRLTPVKQTPVKQTPIRRTIKKSETFEVEKLMKHRKGQREYLVRWKNFGKCDDTWEKENNLSCPKILSEYNKRHRLAKQ